MTAMIPLNQLQSSPSNVRKTGASIEDLAASIEHHGLLQNIVVVERAGKPFVVAGGRRLSALQLLAKGGKLKDNHPVPCMVVGEKEAAEISLAENTVRQAMHPADEFEAFNALAKDGKLTAAEIAVRFGTTARHVEQRLKLANVAPSIIDEYRAGKATLDQVMALSIVEDHALQEKVWKASARSEWERRPDLLRRSMTEREVSATSGLGAFVGVEAYEEAGGTPRRDLFSDVVSLPDAKLVEKLAKKRLDAEAVKLKAKGWGWTEGRIEFDWQDQQKYRMQSGAQPHADLGAIVSLSHSGKIEIHTGLLKPGQKAPASSASKKKKAAASNSGKSREAEQQLVGIRTGAFRAAIRGSQKIALACMAASMAADLVESNYKLRDPVTEIVYFEGMGGYTSPAEAVGLKQTDPTGEESWADWKRVLQAGSKSHGSLLGYLLQRPESEVLRLIVVLVALNASTDNIGKADLDSMAGMHKVAKLIGLDLAKAWTPTVDWLAKQSKDFILDAVTEVKDKAAAKPLEKLKLTDMAAAALPILLEAGWVPEPMRAPSAPKPKVAKKKPAAKKKAAPAKAKK